MVLGQIIGAVLIISLISFVGIFMLFGRKRKVPRFLNYIVSFAAGAMIAAAFFDFLPEAAEHSPVSSVMFWAMIGIIGFFVMEKFLFWYHCHDDECKGLHHKHAAKLNKKSVGYLNLIGDGFHNFLDGAAIAVAFIASPALGWVATLAIALHEIPQEFGDFSILLFAGFSKQKALFYNFLSALAAVLGALIAFFFATAVEHVEPVLLAVAGGGFIYIALVDLLPALHHEANLQKTGYQLAWFIIGVFIIWLLTTQFVHVHG